MAQENAVFSFELNESLYFERGQEVAEVISIALEPEISIQPFNDYISIRGVIELKGEYQRVNDGDERNNDPISDEYPARRYVEQVFESERGETSFSHRFPVEISVPTYRVNDMDDVTVSIDYFDYEIPEQNQLRLTSIIAIQGINDVIETKTDTESVEQNQEEVFTLKDNYEDTFRFDVKEEVEANQAQKPEESYEQEEIDTSVQELAQTRETYMPRDEYLNDEELDEEVPERIPKSSVKPSEDKEKDEEEEKGEKIDYLSNMFRQDEERYSKMKLCIVQDNDTIDTIAERYQVNPLQISKQNKLDEDTITEGQLLYIPVNSSK
ncbi:stage VI sporulation protein D [Virgibacillus sp. DJP39]|uniref:stage VI sporulation protein D n=1 Tax=Virgibacillus sp. DJP39 TaxID=3409790 RepID=UPI003BB4B06C